jgi:uncharacterized SAM-binding protein YcdF (DUF218 family)
LLKKWKIARIILVTSPFHQLRTYLTFAKVLQPYGIEIINYYANTGEWHPATWFLSQEHHKLTGVPYTGSFVLLQAQTVNQSPVFPRRNLSRQEQTW